MEFGFILFSLTPEMPRLFSSPKLQKKRYVKRLNQLTNVELRQMISNSSKTRSKIQQTSLNKFPRQSAQCDKFQME